GRVPPCFCYGPLFSSQSLCFQYHVSGSRNGEVAVIADANRLYGRQDFPAGIAVIGSEGFRFGGVIHDDQNSRFAVGPLISQYISVPGKHANLTVNQDWILVTHLGKFFDDVNQAVVAVITPLLLPGIRTAVYGVG